MPINKRKDQLYFAVLSMEQKQVQKSFPKYNVSYIKAMDQIPNSDYFGPLQLSEWSKILTRLNELVPKKPHLFYVKEMKSAANLCAVLGLYLVEKLRISPEDAVKRLQKKKRFPEFENYFGNLYCNITVEDCIRGFIKASVNFFDRKTFNSEKYRHDSLTSNGNINWIIPDEILACPGPLDVTLRYYYLPEFYADYFLSHNVKVVIQLNKSRYDPMSFTELGMKHFNLEFPDMSSPSLPLVWKFIGICNQAHNLGEAVAVHCHAGLGRTGTMIACYIMNKYKMKAREAIAWIRIVRPTSIFQAQQDFLEMNEEVLHSETELDSKLNELKLTE